MSEQWREGGNQTPTSTPTSTPITSMQWRISPSALIFWHHLRAGATGCCRLPCSSWRLPYPPPRGVGFCGISTYFLHLYKYDLSPSMIDLLTASSFQVWSTVRTTVLQVPLVVSPLVCSYSTMYSTKKRIGSNVPQQKCVNTGRLTIIGLFI